MFRFRSHESHRCTVIPLAGSLRINISSDAPLPLDTRTAAAWAQKLLQNPALFDGPILSLISLDLDAGVIFAKIDRYSRLAVQPTLHTGVRLLSVTTMLVADDALLLLQRGASVHQYPGLWEVGPSGGLAAHQCPIQTLDESMIRAAATDEIEEEIGLAIPAANLSPPLALLRDTAASSDDIVFAADVSGFIGTHTPPHLNWENTDTRWIPLGQLATAATDESLSPPTRTLLSALAV